MWQQQPSKPQPTRVIESIVMWSNRGTTKKVQRGEVDGKIADGWTIAEEGTAVGVYNPIYDKGDVKHIKTITPNTINLPERSLQGDYLKIIQV